MSCPVEIGYRVEFGSEARRKFRDLSDPTGRRLNRELGRLCACAVRGRIANGPRVRGIEELPGTALGQTLVVRHGSIWLTCDVIAADRVILVLTVSTRSELGRAAIGTLLLFRRAARRPDTDWSL